MSSRRYFALGVLAIAAGTSPRPGAAQAAPTGAAHSLCAANERVIFSAAVRRSTKLASLCASQQLDRSSGYVQYRFGRPGHLELQFPATRGRTQRQFCYGRSTAPMVTYLAAAFQTNGVRYEIHYSDNERDASSDTGPAESAWIAVVQVTSKHELARLPLIVPATGSLMGLEHVALTFDQAPCSGWDVVLE